METASRGPMPSPLSRLSRTGDEGSSPGNPLALTSLDPGASEGFRVSGLAMAWAQQRDAGDTYLLARGRMVALGGKGAQG